MNILQKAIASKIKDKRGKGRGGVGGGSSQAGKQHKISQGVTPMHGRGSKNYSITSEEALNQTLSEEELNHFIRSLTYRDIKDFIESIRGGTKVQNGMVQTKIFSDKLRESFDTTPLILAKMAERFKPLRFEGENNQVEKDPHVEPYEAIIALIASSSMKYDKKIELVFQLFDTDGDDCLSPSEILNMLQSIERVFAKERVGISFDSVLLMNNICEKRAVRKFYRMMLPFTKKTLEGKNNTVFEVDQLFNIEEFIEKVRELKNSITKTPPPPSKDDPTASRSLEKEIMDIGDFYGDLLPQVITLRNILEVKKEETMTYEMDQNTVDEFVFFRYELANAYKMHDHRINLGKIGEVLDIDFNERKNDLSKKYRPPGFVLPRNAAEKSTFPTSLKSEIWDCQPSNTRMRRKYAPKSLQELEEQERQRTQNLINQGNVKSPYGVKDKKSKRVGGSKIDVEYETMDIEEFKRLALEQREVERRIQEQHKTKKGAKTLELIEPKSDAPIGYLKLWSEFKAEKEDDKKSKGGMLDFEHDQAAKKAEEKLNRMKSEFPKNSMLGLGKLKTTEIHQELEERKKRVLDLQKASAKFQEDIYLGSASLKAKR